MAWRRRVLGTFALLMLLPAVPGQAGDDSIEDLESAVRKLRSRVVECIDRIEKLVSPDPEALERQRKYILSRKKVILAELDGDGPAWVYPPPLKPREFVKPLPVSGTFSTVWTAQESFLPGKNVSLELTVGGKRQKFAMVLVGAGRMKEGERFQKNSAAVKYYGVRPGRKNIFVGLNTLPSLFRKGDLPFHGLETCGFVVAHDPGTGKFDLLGLIGEGEITFTDRFPKPDWWDVTADKEVNAEEQMKQYIKYAADAIECADLPATFEDWKECIDAGLPAPEPRSV